MDYCNQFCRVAIAVVSLFVLAPHAAAQEMQPATAEAKAQFDQRFKEYQDSLRAIEKLRTDYQTAGASGKKTIDFQLQEKLATAKQQLDAMVAAGLECYRVAPQDNPQLGQLLTAVAKHYTVGEAAPRQKDAINGGDNYERALPIIKLLVDSKSDDKRLPLWGFTAAFALNDYDLAETYLQQAQANGILADPASLEDPTDKAAMGMIMQYAGLLPQYRELWAKEQQIRAAEAAADDLPRVRFETSKGDIVIELFENEAPQSTANFITLVKKGFYNGVTFHRVMPQFMAQGGDPEGTGAGGPGYSINCECYAPNYRHHFRGSLSMALEPSGRDTGGSQFFLTFLPTPHLDGKHTVFGRVVAGMEVLGDLQKRNPVSPGGVVPDKIIKAEVLRDRGHEYTFDKLPGR
jgi:cyclophilin family peptidyl-prolyl cis-trans isomerase